MYRNAMLVLALLAAGPAIAKDDPEGAVVQQISAQSVIDAHIAAYRARKMDDFLQTFAADALLVVDGIEMRGHDQIRRAFAQNFSPQAPMIRIAGRSSFENQIYLEIGYLFSDGIEVCCSFSDYTIENGKITKLGVLSK